jgi:hypothetical protein
LNKDGVSLAASEHTRGGPTAIPMEAREDIQDMSECCKGERAAVIDTSLLSMRALGLALCLLVATSHAALLTLKSPRVVVSTPDGSQSRSEPLGSCLSFITVLTFLIGFL